MLTSVDHIDIKTRLGFSPTISECNFYFLFIVTKFCKQSKEEKKRRLALFWQSVFNDYIRELTLNKKSSVENVYSKKQWHGGILICNLISDLRNQSQFKTIQKFLVLQTLIFFLGLHPEKKQVLKTRIFFRVQIKRLIVEFWWFSLHSWHFKMKGEDTIAGKCLNSN